MVSWPCLTLPDSGSQWGCPSAALSVSPHPSLKESFNKQGGQHLELGFPRPQADHSAASSLKPVCPQSRPTQRHPSPDLLTHQGVPAVGAVPKGAYKAPVDPGRARWDEHTRTPSVPRPLPHRPGQHPQGRAPGRRPARTHPGGRSCRGGGAQPTPLRAPFPLLRRPGGATWPRSVPAPPWSPSTSSGCCCPAKRPRSPPTARTAASPWGPPSSPGTAGSSRVSAAPGGPLRGSLGGRSEEDADGRQGCSVSPLRWARPPHPPALPAVPDGRDEYTAQAPWLSIPGAPGKQRRDGEGKGEGKATNAEPWAAPAGAGRERVNTS